MQNILIRLSYDGTHYHGFQKQKNTGTVQGALEKALSELYFGKEIKTSAAGRTDAGAHARDQAVNYQAPPSIPVDRIPAALNSRLPPDIAVWSACLVDADFNARHRARGKLYTYTIDNASFPQPLERLYAWHYPGRLEVNLMHRAAQVLVGKNDFKEFQASGSSAGVSVRTVFEVFVEKIPDRNLVRIKVTGDGFLYKMVRFMAGALFRVGRGRLPVEELQRVVEGDAGRSWEALPAKGLCLEKIFF